MDTATKHQPGTYAVASRWCCPKCGNKRADYQAPTCVWDGTRMVADSQPAQRVSARRVELV